MEKTKWHFMLDNLAKRLQMIADKQIEELRKIVDTDALLTVLSRDHGKLTVKARGLRRKNSPLVAPCQLLAPNETIAA